MLSIWVYIPMIAGDATESPIPEDPLRTSLITVAQE